MAANVVTIGNVQVTSLSDGIMEFDLCNFFPSLPAENWDPYEDTLTSEHRVRLNLASYLIRSEGRIILVDTGMGPKAADEPDTGWGELLTSFASLGVRPDEVDMVVMTHLHRDHVGWNLRSNNGKYEPTFPKAKYWMSKRDWEATRQPELKERFANAPISVWPLEDLGVLELIEGEGTLTSEVTTLPTPGHTPGHISVVISSQGQKGMVLGDIVHNIVQVHEVDWCSRADIDPDQTRITRRTLMERLESEGSLVAAGHFPAPGFGKIVRLEGRRYWQAL